MAKFRRGAVQFCAGLLFVLSATFGLAQGPAAGDQQHMSQLGPGDSVTIQIFGQADPTPVYVGDDGTINVPLAGKIQVAGMSPVEAAVRVEKALKDGQYFVDPHVTLMVTQSHSQLVTVLGQVQNVGRYQITPQTTIVDLLAQAGGLKETASDFGYVLRNDGSGHVNRLPVQLSGLRDAKDTLPSVTLLGGDALVVPNAEHFYAYGEVASPGTYRIDPGMTVIQAIARAGGITIRGSERRIEVKRLGQNGKYRVIHAKPDDLVQADDTIQVKESIF
jgi:polysaccharide export outer membrane protein